MVEGDVWLGESGSDECGDHLPPSFTCMSGQPVPFLSSCIAIECVLCAIMCIFAKECDHRHMLIVAATITGYSSG